VYTEVVAVLIDIESELRQLSLWESQAPSAEALASDQPFAVDTLSLPQWIQFVFLPTLYQLSEMGQILPTQCGIRPMAEEHFRATDLRVQPLLEALEAVDALLSSRPLTARHHTLRFHSD
jgi:uncharacterized protein YqcC (DUF446 family)